MKAIIVKKFTFEAGHFIPNHPKCGEVHGHSWVLKVSVKGELKENGMIMDFHDLKDLVQNNVLYKLDHKFLNNEFNFIPTCENLVEWIWNELAGRVRGYGVELQRIKLAETANNFVSYYGEN